MMNWQTLPTINANRVLLRPISDGDIESLFKIFSDPEVMRYWSTPPLKDLDAARELLNDMRDKFQRKLFFQWGIALQTDNTLIGTSTLFHIEADNHRAEIGYALGRAYWKKGYIQEALTALLGYAFGELNLHRIEADVDPRNEASIRTLERLGFTREGYLRERWNVCGELQDALFYGLLRHEWKPVGTSNPSALRRS
jgi:RimJ/RimL family protein N-acetyltransferase